MKVDLNHDKVYRGVFSYGRGLIPQNLKEYAGIEKEIVSIGVLSRVEVWSKEKWNEYNDSDINFDKISEKMSELGI